MTITKIKSLESGEARWIGRPDIHVYCANPMRLTMMPTGREGWRREPEAARYCVVAEGHDYGTWVTAVEAARLVDSMLADDVPVDTSRTGDRPSSFSATKHDTPGPPQPRSVETPSGETRRGR